jgi:SAM-dependent methyltransferase
MKELRERIYNASRSPSKVLSFVDDALFSSVYKRECNQFIQQLKESSPYILKSNENIKLNKLCNIEDWEKHEIINTIPTFYKKGQPIFIHRKDWELALGIIAMQRYGKLNDQSVALGVGSGKEPVLFYLANILNHVYATDLYTGTRWQGEAPADFPSNPSKYAPFSYKEDALTVLKMDGTKLEFPSEKFDIAFSFSSIEHFGGKNHQGSLKALREIERVLKPGGIAVIATEYIINNKDHPEFFNGRTIHRDLIDKLDQLKLIGPLDLRITSNTLDIVIDYYTMAFDWDYQDDQYKQKHPHILMRLKNLLFTSLMLVFQKEV